MLRRRLHDGNLQALLSDLWYFLRDSTPERRRARFGDLEYDFDHDVDTTASNVSTGTRLAGAIAGAGYQPTDPEVLRSMLDQLTAGLSRFTFVDIGSGKGRALLIASDYPFRCILGVELLPELHAVAVRNIARHQSAGRRCGSIASLCLDAREFTFPAGPLVVYLFNPLPEEALRIVISSLTASLAATPRECFVLYANPVLEHLLSTSRVWIRHSGNERYAIYKSTSSS